MWNSLEIAKLTVAAATPVFVAIIGFWLNRRLKSLEQAQWSQQKVIERRIKAYDETREAAEPDLLLLLLRGHLEGAKAS